MDINWKDSLIATGNKEDTAVVRCVTFPLPVLSFSLSGLLFWQGTYLPQRHENQFIVLLWPNARELLGTLEECKTKKHLQIRDRFQKVLKTCQNQAQSFVVFRKHTVRGKALLPLPDVQRGQDPREVKSLWISTYFTKKRSGQKA